MQSLGFVPRRAHPDFSFFVGRQSHRHGLRPEIYPVKKMIGFTADMLESIDKWRAKQRPIPNVSDAIRHLIEIGLEVRSPKG